MQYVPRNYQEFTTKKIIELPEVGPFLDMGLGKTVSCLTALIELIKNKKVKKILVIAPKKVAETVWTDEIEKWDHLKHLTVSKILGTEKERKNALSKKADIYIINRENIVWLVALFGIGWPFDTVVIDELSSFKSHKSQRFKSLRLVRKFMTRVIGLTGTPAPNGLLDIWSQVFLLDKGNRLGDSFTRYRDMYFDAGKRDGYVVFNYNLKKGNVLLGDDFYKKEIFDRIKDICFSMKTEDYLDIPEKIDNDRYITLPSSIQDKYIEFERKQILEFSKEKEISAINAAALTNKLLQFANGAVYDDKKMYHVVHDEMIETLKEIIDELNGKPLLLFYQFTSDVNRIQTVFKDAVLLKTPQHIKDWNNGKIKLMMAHPLSAGHGLNLQFGGEDILWFGCPWSLEQYGQGIKRVHRSGVRKFVTNTRLIVRNTMHEDVIRALNGKDKMQEAVIKAVKARIEKYTLNL